MLLTRAVRPDRLILAAKLFVESVFGPEFAQKADALLNLEQIINEEVKQTGSFSFIVSNDAVLLTFVDTWFNTYSALLCSGP